MTMDDNKETVQIHIMGRPYEVTKGITIQSAFEEAGYLLIRGSGCRGGFCGGCTTVYRKEGDYKLYADLACQKTVEEGMHFTQIPYTPSPRTNYNLMDDGMEASTEVVIEHYPEVMRCISCNRCTNACPQDLDVMGFINDVHKGDLKEITEKSFDCIQCGICALRCPAEISPYHVAQLARRLQGKYGEPTDEFMQERIQEIKEGKFDGGLKELKQMPKRKIEKRYESREIKL